LHFSTPVMYPYHTPFHVLKYHSTWFFPKGVAKSWYRCSKILSGASRRGNCVCYFLYSVAFCKSQFVFWQICSVIVLCSVAVEWKNNRAGRVYTASR
jgi:hypothetical protein